MSEPRRPICAKCNEELVHMPCCPEADEFGYLPCSEHPTAPVLHPVRLAVLLDDDCVWECRP